MANLHETATWAEAIYQLERTDPMTGGADGIANRQAGELANRTKWLKEELETRRIALDAKITDSIAALIADAPDTLNTLGAIANALDGNTAVGAELADALARITELESLAATKTEVTTHMTSAHMRMDDMDTALAAEASRVNADIATERGRLDDIDTALAQGYVAKYRQDGLAPGWYTIATNAGSRAVARFALWCTDHNHQTCIFYAQHQFGNNAANALTVLAHTEHYKGLVSTLRIKEAATYDGAALQAYLHKENRPINVAILGDNFQEAGWVLTDWLPDSTTPPDVDNWANFTPKSQIDLANISQGGMATTGEIYAGGDMTQHQVLHTGTRGLIAPHHLQDGVCVQSVVNNTSLQGSVAAGKINRIFSHTITRAGLYLFAVSFNADYHIAPDGLPHSAKYAAYMPTSEGRLYAYGTTFNGTSGVYVVEKPANYTFYADMVGANNQRWKTHVCNVSLVFLGG